MTEPGMFTIAEAATWAGVAARTIRRRLHDGRFPGAVRQGTTASSPWLIPVADLEAAGFRAAGDHAQVVEVVTPDPTVELRAALAERDRTIAQQALTIAEQNAKLAARDAALAELRDRVGVADRNVAELAAAVRVRAELDAASPAPRRAWWRRRDSA